MNLEMYKPPCLWKRQTAPPLLFKTSAPLLANTQVSPASQILDTLIARSVDLDDLERRRQVSNSAIG